jgi:hypothetical protein
MKAALLPPGDPAWDTFLRDVRHDFYHLPAYAALCAEVEGAEARALFVEDGDQRMLVPLLLRSIEADLRDATTPYGYPTPLVASAPDGFLAEALSFAKGFLAREKIVSVFVRGHPLLGPALPSEVGTVVTHGNTVSIDLAKPTEQLWRETISGHRNEINKAMRAGHRVFFDDTFEYLAPFAKIYRGTMDRVHASAYYFFSDEYFADLRAALGDRLRLCVVEIGGEIAAGSLFVETCGLVQYHLSGTDARFVRERPNKLILHFVRASAKERGCDRLHLGGGLGSAEDSLFKFKAGFSPDRHPFRTLRLVCDEDAYASLAARRAPSADAADRSGFFPIYRKPST